MPDGAVFFDDVEHGVVPFMGNQRSCIVRLAASTWIKRTAIEANSESGRHFLRIHDAGVEFHEKRIRSVQPLSHCIDYICRAQNGALRRASVAGADVEADKDGGLAAREKREKREETDLFAHIHGFV